MVPIRKQAEGLLVTRLGILDEGSAVTLVERGEVIMRNDDIEWELYTLLSSRTTMVKIKNPDTVLLTMNENGNTTVVTTGEICTATQVAYSMKGRRKLYTSGTVFDPGGLFRW